MADFAVADPEEGLNETGNPNPVTPSGFLQNLGASFNTGPSGIFGATGYVSRIINKTAAETGLTPGQMSGEETQFFPSDYHVPQPEPSLAAKDLQGRFPDAKFTEPLPLSVAAESAKAQADSRKQANLYARYPNGFLANAPLVGAQAIAGLLDPVSDAAFMVPIIGETRYATWLAQAGESAGLAGRAGVTLGVGAARGVAGQAILTAGEAPEALSEGTDISLGSAARDLLTAGIGGAALHGAFAFHGDILGNRFLESPEGRVADGNAAIHDAAVQTGAAQLASGRPFDVRPVFDAAKYRSDLMGSTALEAPGLDPEAQARAGNAVARAAGAPSQADLRWDAEAQAARTAPDRLKVDEGQIAEAKAAVEQMRAAGHLTPEDEAMLADLERPPSVAGTPEQASWHLAADQGGVPRSIGAQPEEILATAVSREAKAPADPEEFRTRAEGWIDERISQVAPDLAEELKAQGLNHETIPKERGAVGAPDQGGERPAPGHSGEAGAGPIGEGTVGSGEHAAGSEPDARAGASRLTASGEQRPADVGLFALPKRGEPTMFERLHLRRDAEARRVYGAEKTYEKLPDPAKLDVDQRLADPLGDGRGNAAYSKPAFERGRAADVVALSDHIIAELPEHPTAAEQSVIDHVSDIARQIVPKAKVVAARALAGIEDGAHETEGEAFPVTGVTYVNGARRIIAWSLESPDAVGTLRHEGIHWLKRENFIQPEEWSALEASAHAGGWIDKHDIAGRYPDLDEAGQLEEAVADEFGDWRRAPDSIPEAFKPLYERIMQLLAHVGDFLRRSFGANATADDIFSRIMSGEVGNRTPDEQAPRYGSTAFEKTPQQAAREAEMEPIIAARQRLTAYQDLQKRQALIQAVQNFHDQTVNRPTLRHPISGIDRKLPLASSIDALTRGISEAVKGARESTASEQLARANDFLGGLQSGLDKIPGGMEAWRSRSLTKEWVKELHELSREGGKPGISKSPMALEIARAVKQAQDVARMRLNKSGAWIGDYDGYISRTAHNAVKIDQAGYQAWKTFTLERLDQDRTFGDIDPGKDADTFGSNGSDEVRGQEIDRFLKATWDGLSTGIHMSSQGGVGKGGAFSGAGSLGRKLSSERVLHWKDADAWREYQEKFGDPVIERGIMNGLHRAAHDAALMRRWGSNPQYTFDNLLRTIKVTYRDDHEAISDFQKAEPRLREEFAYLSGANQMPGFSLAWKIRSGILAWQDITKLGNVLFAHFSAAATKPFQLAYHGVGKWQAYSSVIRNLVEDGTPEGRQTLENLRANATGQTQDIISGYEPIDGVPGRIANLRMAMMRLGGLPWLLARQKSGTEWELANFLGQRLGSEFEALKPQTQRALKIYGIDKPEWDALRGAPDHDTDGQGLTYLTPKAAQRASDASIDALAGSRITRGMGANDIARIRDETRDRLMMKLAGYYSDSADRSTVTPGIPERAMFSRIGGKFGGPIIGQYKTWAAAAVRQLWGQALYGSSRAEAVKALAGLVATGTAFGYLRNVAKDVASGKSPRMFNGDPENDAAILFSSMVQGGGLGILGDMILGQFEANAGTGKERALKYIATLAGPLIGDVAEAGGVGFDYANASFDKHPGKAFQRANAEALHTLTAHLPAVNLFYLRTLFNYLIFDRLYDMASPGYNKRYMARVKEQSAGQTFFAPPTHYLGYESYPAH